MKTTSPKQRKAPSFTKKQLALLNVGEKKLVQDSVAKKTGKKPTVAGLKKSVTRTRALLAKHRDLLKRQAARSKVKTARKSVTDKNHLDNNQRTRAKIAIFQSTLANYQNLLKTTSATTPKSAVLATKTRKTAPRTNGKVATSSKRKLTSEKIAKRTSPQAMLGHISSQGRRNQSRRDSRNG